MNTLEQDIYNRLLQGRSVILVGPTEEGKTWFVKNKLIPLFDLNKQTYQYIYGFINDPVFVKSNFVIVDEYETFLDRDFLEKRYPEDVPYYNDKYFNDVSRWHRLLAGNKIPTVYILTRNEGSDIDNVLSHVGLTDWGNKVDVIEFIRKP